MPSYKPVNAVVRAPSVLRAISTSRQWRISEAALQTTAGQIATALEEARGARLSSSGSLGEKDMPASKGSRSGRKPKRLAAAATG